MIASCKGSIRNRARKKGWWWRRSYCPPINNYRLTCHNNEQSLSWNAIICVFYCKNRYSVSSCLSFSKNVWQCWNRLMYLITNNFFPRKQLHLWRHMALMLGVSQRTIENRMAEYALTNKSQFSHIEDDLLDSFIQRIMTNLPPSGKGSRLSYLYF